ncbi:MAG: hypothetical protein U0414_43830 [Polyangiaceae bacterium]
MVKRSMPAFRVSIAIGVFATFVVPSMFEGATRATAPREGAEASRGRSGAKAEGALAQLEPPVTIVTDT